MHSGEISLELRGSTGQRGLPRVFKSDNTLQPFVALQGEAEMETLTFTF